MMGLGVEGMMVSPGYGYEKAPDQDHFLKRERTSALFNEMLAEPKKGWRFNQSPLFLEFLKGNWELECTPWGTPTYNIFGWQKPCYLLQEGYCETFKELLETTNWPAYGRASGNPSCQDCMVHCGYEPSAVSDTFSNWRGFWKTASLTMFGPGRRKAKPPGTTPPSAPQTQVVRQPASRDLYELELPVVSR
jgi:MoaA/NifB/PqqE/SkfB family radical SAM enzyme